MFFFTRWTHPTPQPNVNERVLRSIKVDMCYLGTFLSAPTLVGYEYLRSVRDDRQIQIVHVAISLVLFEARSNILFINKVNILVLATWLYRPKIVLSIEPNVDNILWARNPMLFALFFFGCPFLDPPPNHIHSSIGVQRFAMLELGTST